jgi:hypothetical protein
MIKQPLTAFPKRKFQESMTMKPTAILTAALLCALSPISFAVAGEIWVSPSGDDSSKGSKDQPFKTFERVAKAVRETSSGSKDEGVTVWFRGGRYPVGRTAQIDSKVSGPILFRAVEGEVPVLDSGLPLAKLVSGVFQQRPPAAGEWRNDSRLTHSSRFRQIAGRSDSRALCRWGQSDLFAQSCGGHDGAFSGSLRNQYNDGKVSREEVVGPSTK